jgi:shikimate dehydrogenase
MWENSMNESFRAACVVGWPAGHSRSPLIHNYWIKQHGLSAEYRREAVPPEKFAEFIASFDERGYVGANVTLPHKEAALKLSRPDECAEVVGAANTLWLERGALRSTNTDVEGCTENLDTAVPGWDAELVSAMVLGAGGAARAVVYALLQRGAGRVYLANRTFEKAEAFRARFGDRVHPVRWGDANGRMGDVQILANATSLGMAGQPELDVDVTKLPARAVVADIVYVPLETPLLSAARQRGLRTADGLGMLLHQAVRGFSLWFGVRPEVTEELRALVEADLKAGATAEK